MFFSVLLQSTIQFDVVTRLHDLRHKQHTNFCGQDIQNLVGSSDSILPTETLLPRVLRRHLHVAACSSIVDKAYFCQYMWMTSQWLERSRIWLQCGRNCGKSWILTNLHHFLTTYTWDALSGNANRRKQSLNSRSSHVFLLEQQRNYRDGKNLSHKQYRGPTTWKDSSKMR